MKGDPSPTCRRATFSDLAASLTVQPGPLELVRPSFEDPLDPGTIPIPASKLGSRRLDYETAWIERYKEIWDRRFDALEIVVQELRHRKENK